MSPRITGLRRSFQNIIHIVIHRICGKLDGTNYDILSKKIVLKTFWILTRFFSLFFRYAHKKRLTSNYRHKSVNTLFVSLLCRKCLIYKDFLSVNIFIKMTGAHE